MKKVLLLSIVCFIIFYIFFQCEKNQDQIDNKVFLSYNEVFEDNLFDIKFHISPEPQFNSVSQGTLSIKPLKLDLNLQLCFTDHPYFEILSNKTYNIKTKLNEETEIPISIRFNKFGPSALYTVINLTDEDFKIVKKEKIIKTYFFVPVENEEQLESLEKNISFDEQKMIPRISKIPTKAHLPIPLKEK